MFKRGITRLPSGLQSVGIPHGSELQTTVSTFSEFFLTLLLPEGFSMKIDYFCPLTKQMRIFIDHFLPYECVSIFWSELKLNRISRKHHGEYICDIFNY